MLMVCLLMQWGSLLVRISSLAQSGQVKQAQSFVQVGNTQSRVSVLGRSSAGVVW